MRLKKLMQSWKDFPMLQEYDMMGWRNIPGEREQIKRDFLSKCAGWTEEEGLVECYNSDLVLLYNLYAERLCQTVLFKVKNVVPRYYGRSDSRWSGMFREKNEIKYIDINPYPLMRMQRDKIPAADIDGVRVTNTLDALLLVFEHELTHLIEKTSYGNTSHGERFKDIAALYFGHDPKAAVGHTLPTKSSSMRNTGDLDFHAGDKVRFEHRGRILYGEIARINKRASVKITAPAEFLNSTFYVPLLMLQRVKEGD